MNPYTHWLDIPESACPPNYFLLLGVEEDEDNEVRIKSAYYRRVAKVSVYQYGDAAEQCNALLLDFADARDCLLDPRSRQRYLEALRSGQPLPANRRDAAEQDDVELVEVEEVIEEADVAAEVQPSDAASIAGEMLQGVDLASMGFGQSSPADASSPLTSPAPKRVPAKSGGRNPFGILSVVRSPDEILQEVIEQRGATPFQSGFLNQGQADQLVVGPYLLDQHLRTGSWGDTYVASRISSGEVVVLTRLNEEFDKELGVLKSVFNKVSRLSLEYHPRVIDCGSHDHRLYQATELITGEDLFAFVSKHGPLSPHQAIYCIDSLAKGLQTALRAGLVHQELRPRKVWLTQTGDIYVRDLILANVVSVRKQRLLKTNQLIQWLPKHHLDYTAPESLTSDKSKPAHADMYSLGCLLHFCLTGQAVFPRDESLSTVIAHREERVKALKPSVAGVTDEIDQLLQRLLAKAPQARFGSYTDLRQSLRTAFRSLPKSPVNPRQLWGKVGTEVETKIDVRPHDGVSRLHARRLAMIVGGGIAAAVLIGGMIVLSLGGDSVAEETVPATELPTTRASRPVDALPESSGFVPTLESDDVFEVK
ncbi:serine/threonine protein kinase [Neorhodopirellula pilleata]|uniref:Serine/threonine-protein kinase PknH n=1 Tax=Neorhodopirellula pilleata TaxID=2714738 RepID=A0A5C5ZZM3_9BACT|nr:protein kinase [Neorhodopirellula pilleata]TWT92481.1 Serine/threonine-protein kinase PknH [Neorhodopirellula pilleata]